MLHRSWWQDTVKYTKKEKTTHFRVETTCNISSGVRKATIQSKASDQRGREQPHELTTERAEAEFEPFILSTSELVTVCVDCACNLFRDDCGQTT